MSASSELRPRTASRSSRVRGTAIACIAGCAQWLATQAAPAASSDDTGGLAEVTITAEKFQSTVQDTPISVTAVTSEDLEKAGIASVEDITRSVPGISMRFASPGLTEYEARGLASNGGAAPTVGFYLDEIPLSPPALSQSGKVVMDPNLYDINRVEILRGPQGTLYGSGSMGGTVKVVTNQPKLGVFEGSVQGTLSDTQGGGGNWGGNAALNLPVGDMLAVRIVGGDLYRSGWLNLVAVNVPNAATALLPSPSNPGVPPNQSIVYNAPVTSVVRHANDEHLAGGRVTVLFKVNDDLSITGMAFQQKLHLGGYDLRDASPTSPSPGPTYNGHYEVFPLREGLHDDIHIYGLNINANLGFADLTSATSYFDRLNWQAQDASQSLYYSNGPSGAPAAPLAPVLYSEVDPSRQFSQEFRLTSHDVGALHWVAGVFYSSLHSVWQEISHSPLNASAATPDGSYFTSYNPYSVKQTALFADGSYKLTDAWKVAAGVRWYTYKSEQHEFSWGIDAPYPNPAVTPVQITRASDRGFNPRVNVSYEPSHDLNLYATVSKGFRPGGANQILPTGAPIFCQAGVLAFGPDSAWNYEMGEKARLMDGRLTVNGDVYYIKWQGVQQVITLPCGYQYYNNAGDARAYGPELEVNARLTSHWSASLSGAYTDSKITAPNASFLAYLSGVANTPYGPPSRPCPATGGCTVPILNVSKDTLSAALMYTQAIGADYELTARLDDSYIGPQTDVAYYFGYQVPGYNIANLHVTLGHKNWSANVFVDNLGNKVALMSANNTSFQFNIPQTVRYSTNQPRTFGTQVNYHF